MLDGTVSGDLLLAGNCEIWHQQLCSVCLQCVGLWISYKAEKKYKHIIRFSREGSQQFCALIT